MTSGCCWISRRRPDRRSSRRSRAPGSSRRCPSRPSCCARRAGSSTSNSSRSQRISAISSRVSCGFMPAAGSSSSSTFGSVASARAISRRRWLPYGRLVAASSAQRVELEDLEQLHRALARLASPRDGAAACRAPRRPAVWRLRRWPRDHDVVEHASCSANRRMFWNVRATPSARDLVRLACRRSRSPSKTISPSVGVVDAGQQVEDRGLAGAVRADEAVRARRRGTVHRERLDRRQAAEPHRDVARLEERRSGSAIVASGRRRPPPAGATAPASSASVNSRRAEQALRPEDHQQDQQQRVDHHPQAGNC